ncbi:MAG: sec-independent protein translocase TatC [Verrucomicrobia bacterium]|nr:MAG: sec-independent protein translocase TatC [Verrucomicrobiota bacterium]
MPWEINMSDITTTEDITKFMELFYDRLLRNPIAAPLFADIDMEAHMPRVVAFWEGIAFGASQYQGSPFQPHVPLALTSEHFTIWYETFTSCLDELFEGSTATMMKERAHSIAFIFSAKLGISPPEI